MITKVSQLWEKIETCGFREDLKDIKANAQRHYDDDNKEDDDEVEDNDKDDNDDKGISALGLDKDLGFSCSATKPKWIHIHVQSLLHSCMV